MSNSMLSSMTEVEERIRNYVHSKVTPDMLYAFDLIECEDVSDNAAGTLLEQDKDFWLFEVYVEGGRRAGPGWHSPRRYTGSLDLAFFTKSPRDKVKYTRMLESVADWFQDQTIDGIRLRTFIPSSITPLHGFTSYNGVISLEFEINLSR